MKKILLLILLLQGCSVFAGEDKGAPSGEEVFDLLMENVNIPLSKEPLCNLKSTTRNDSNITLGQHLSTLFATSYNNSNRVVFTSTCARSKFDKGKEAIDVWDCELNMNETRNQKEFISSATIKFSVPLNKRSVIPGSLRCY